MQYFVVGMVSFWEKYAPYVGAVLGGVLAHFLTLPNAPEFLSGLATVGSILAGLTGTSLSILLSYNAPIIGKIRAAGYFINLMKWVRGAALLSLLLAITALGGFFYEHPSEIFYYKYFLLASAGSSVAAFLRLFWLIPKIGAADTKNQRQQVISSTLNENHQSHSSKL